MLLAFLFFQVKFPSKFRFNRHHLRWDRSTRQQPSPTKNRSRCSPPTREPPSWHVPRLESSDRIDVSALPFVAHVPPTGWIDSLSSGAFKSSWILVAWVQSDCTDRTGQCPVVWPVCVHDEFDLLSLSSFGLLERNESCGWPVAEHFLISISTCLFVLLVWWGFCLCFFAWGTSGKRHLSWGMKCDDDYQKK